jgi:hypothetical protein
LIVLPMSIYDSKIQGCLMINIESRFPGDSSGKTGAVQLVNSLAVTL